MSATKTLLDTLRGHYIAPNEPMPGGVFIPECGINGRTGSRADALYVGFTSASGRLLVGHELKVSKSDWRRELEKAGKADFWADNCHQWIVVAPGPDVVPAEEVPQGWGLMYPARGRRMQIVIKPETRTDLNPSWEAVRSIMSRLDTLRAAHDRQVQDAARDEMLKLVDKQVADRVSRAGGITSDQREQINALEKLEKIFGAPIKPYVWNDDGEGAIDATVAAAALRLVTATKAITDVAGPRYNADSLARAADGLLAGLAAYTDAREALLAVAGANR